jgi:hypothetical protein
MNECTGEYMSLCFVLWIGQERTGNADKDGFAADKCVAPALAALFVPDAMLCHGLRGRSRLPRVGTEVVNGNETGSRDWLPCL